MADIITYSAASGMQAHMTSITNTTNNLTNSKTPGYRSVHTITSDNFYNHLQRAGVADAQDVGEKPVGVAIGTGVRVTGTYRDLSQGALKNTGNPLDIAMVGSGLLAVNMPNNQRGYTRSGTLQVNNNRQLVTLEGYTLAEDIVIPDNIQISQVKVSPEGLISADIDGELVEIGQLQLYGFNNENGLKEVGSGYFLETESSGEGAANIPGQNGFGTIAQFQVEMSNVDIASEFASFMAAQQAYDMSARMLRAVDEMFKELNK